MAEEQKWEYMERSKLDNVYQGKYDDDISGEELDDHLGSEARQEEMKEVYKHALYENVSIQQCWRDTG